MRTLSNTSPAAPQSVLDKAARYVGEGTKFEGMEDVNELLWGFDVVGECREVFAAA